MSRRSISLLSSLLFVLLLFTPTILADSEHEFQEFARDVPADRLHAALHDYSGAKFKHVKLAKRQSNTTTTSRNTATTSTAARPTTPTTIVSTSPSSTGQSTQSTRQTTTSESKPTTTAPSVTSARGTTSLTSKITKTVTAPDGSISTMTSVTIVPAPTDDSTSSPPGETASSTDKGTPGLQQNVGLRVSGGDSVIVAVIAALGFFML